MDYNEFQYLFPPRPDTKIAQGMLGFYQNKGWIGQVKKNGTCTVVFASPDEVIYRTRHAATAEDPEKHLHKMWKEQDQALLTPFFKSRCKQGWSVFVGELMHSKVSGGPKNDLYIFDQLVDNGNYLVDSTLEERLELLKTTVGVGTFEKDKHRVNQHISRAHNFTRGFATLFNQLGPEDEGLVLKNPKARLNMCSAVGSNNDWQVKSRIPHKNYGF